MTHEMNDGVVRWAAQRARAALDALDAHDKRTRELLDHRARGAVLLEGAFDGRSDARIDLAAQVAEASRVLVAAVLGQTSATAPSPAPVCRHCHHPEHTGFCRKGGCACEP